VRHLVRLGTGKFSERECSEGQTVSFVVSFQHVISSHGRSVVSLIGVEGVKTSLEDISFVEISTR
jgi:hypothetical protein